MAKLILVRHALSEWNDKGLWTGLTDVPLSEQGKMQASETAKQLHGIDIHRVYSSTLSRAKETLDYLLEHLGLPALPRTEHPALNERDYGIYTGKNKWQVKEEVGEVKFHRIRRSWDEPIPEGETLQEVHDSIVPYYEDAIKKDLLAGYNVCVVAHGNSLRALVKHLEGLSVEQIADREIGVGEAHVYEIDEKGGIIGKEIRAKKEDTGKI